MPQMAFSSWCIRAEDNTVGQHRESAIQVVVQTAREVASTHARPAEMCTVTTLYR